MDFGFEDAEVPVCKERLHIKMRRERLVFDYPSDFINFSQRALHCSFNAMLLSFDEVMKLNNLLLCHVSSIANLMVGAKL